MASPEDNRVVIYDDQCGFCVRSVRLLQTLDRGGVHRYEGSSNEAALLAAGVTADEVDEELKLAADGRLWGGYDAIVEVLRALPLTSWLTPLLRFGPVRRTGRRIYRWIAARRKCTYHCQVEDRRH